MSRGKVWKGSSRDNNGEKGWEILPCTLFLHLFVCFSELICFTDVPVPVLETLKSFVLIILFISFLESMRIWGHHDHILLPINDLSPWARMTAQWGLGLVLFITVALYFKWCLGEGTHKILFGWINKFEYLVGQILSKSFFFFLQKFGHSHLFILGNDL